MKKVGALRTKKKKKKTRPRFFFTYVYSHEGQPRQILSPSSQKNNGAKGSKPKTMFRACRWNQLAPCILFSFFSSHFDTAPKQRRTPSESHDASAETPKRSLNRSRPKHAKLLSVVWLWFGGLYCVLFTKVETNPSGPPKKRKQWLMFLVLVLSTI